MLSIVHPILKTGAQQRRREVQCKEKGFVDEPGLTPLTLNVLLCLHKNNKHQLRTKSVPDTISASHVPTQLILETLATSIIPLLLSLS